MKKIISRIVLGILGILFVACGFKVAREHIFTHDAYEDVSVENWEVGNTYTINWNPGVDPFTSIVLIRDDDDDQLDMVFIASNVPNNGKFTFTVPRSLHGTTLAGNWFELRRYPNSQKFTKEKYVYVRRKPLHP